MLEFIFHLLSFILYLSSLILPNEVAGLPKG
jgi:hypothetical protein